MQGSYNSNGLPRPFYMAPSKKKQLPYENLPVNFFTTAKRKIIGYILMFLLFGTMIYWISQDLRVQPEPVYEMVSESLRDSQLDIGNVDIQANMKEGDNADLAAGLLAGSKGDKGYAVDEAPMGGIANEAVVVGSDEDLIVGNGKPKKMQGDGVGKGKVAAPPNEDTNDKKKGYQADKE